MNTTRPAAYTLSYRTTGAFSALASDYADQTADLDSFRAFPVNQEGIAQALKERAAYPVNRQLLVDYLKDLYSTIDLHPAQAKNLAALESHRTFTVTTAHQPNLGTGPLYFLFKIIHAIKLADSLNKQYPAFNVVPVYYMGSEDADLDELGNFTLQGTRYTWDTRQTGAVGRMKADAALQQLLDAASGFLTVLPHGPQLVERLKKAYAPKRPIAAATFELVNELFARFGLLIFQPDDARVKSGFARVMEQELTTQFSAAALQKVAAQFPEKYKLQTAGRALNLFYLTDTQRRRIEYNGSEYTVVDSELKFDQEAVLKELNHHPERFSPNVVLRPVLQELLLPDIAFIGGGAELAYWMELREVFREASVFFPMLILRNSYLLAGPEVQSLMHKHQLDELALFQSERRLVEDLVQRHSTIRLQLLPERERLNELYDEISQLAGKADVTLAHHTGALFHGAEKRLLALEKKMFRAERKKMDASVRQLSKLKSGLFPGENLQERVESGLYWLALYGDRFLDWLYDHALTTEQQFTVLYLPEPSNPL